MFGSVKALYPKTKNIQEARMHKTKFLEFIISFLLVSFGISGKISTISIIYVGMKIV